MDKCGVSLTNDAAMGLANSLNKGVGQTRCTKLILRGGGYKDTARPNPLPMVTEPRNKRGPSSNLGFLLNLHTIASSLPQQNTSRTQWENRTLNKHITMQSNS